MLRNTDAINLDTYSDDAHNIWKLHAISLQGTATGDASYKYVIGQFQKYQVTPEQVCRNPKGAYHQAATYLCYLQSSRRNQVICNKVCHERLFPFRTKTIIGIKIREIHGCQNRRNVLLKWEQFKTCSPTLSFQVMSTLWCDTRNLRFKVQHTITELKMQLFAGSTKLISKILN